LAKNLFHRAISESGVALTAPLIKKDVKPIAEVSLTLVGFGTPFHCSPGIFRDLSSCDSAEMLKGSLRQPWLSRKAPLGVH
jgi:carboxylesterase 1